VFHLRDGAVIAVDSAGSPQAALVARGHLRPDEIQAVATAAIQDGAVYETSLSRPD
jgi:hypothetical protein